MDKDTLEILVTAGLFLLNAIIIVVFAAVCVVYYLAVDVSGLLQCRKMKVMRLVTDEAVVTRELARSDTGREGGAAANDPDYGAVPALCWRHPGTGAAQVHPPKQYSRDGVAEGVWGWTDANGKESWSKETPQLVAARGEWHRPAARGDFVCKINTKTLIMSPLVEVPHDVMGSRDDRPGDGAAYKAQTRNSLVGGCRCRCGRRLKTDEARFVVDGDVQLTEVHHENEHAHRLDVIRTSDNWFYTDDDDEAVLHGPHTVAELRDWVDGGHFQLTDCVRHGRTGDLVELSSVLHVAPAAAEGTISDSTGKDDNWFYTDGDDEAVLHGPHTVVELRDWFDGGHFHRTQPVRHGRTGDLVELSSVLHVAPAAAAAEGTVPDSTGKDDDWFYTNEDDEALLHGPYSVAVLQEWATNGHFPLTDLVRKGRTGTPVELSSVLHAAPM